MILEHYSIPQHIHKKEKYSGCDHPERVVDTGKLINEDGIDKLKHWHAYSKPVHYTYNSRGFRDEEWPSSLSELQETPIIFGDSFIVGLGQPEEERVSNLLGAINYAMDGASNDWIARRGSQYLEEVKPKKAAVQWSYVHRRESNDNTIEDDSLRKLWYSECTVEEDLDNFIQNVIKLESVAINNNVNLVHSFIPGFARKKAGIIKWGDLKEIRAKAALEVIDMARPYIKKCVDFCMVIDYSRDAHHYDIETAKKYAEEIEKRWQN